MRESYLYGIIGLLAGVALAGVFSWSGSWRMMDGYGYERSGMHGMDMSMNGMTAALQGKEADEFDRAFLLMMIPHHEGALEMAELARTHAKHDEIKALAEAIIASQSKEIAEMKSWQANWGY